MGLVSRLGKESDLEEPGLLHRKNNTPNGSKIYAFVSDDAHCTFRVLLVILTQKGCELCVVFDSCAVEFGRAVTIHDDRHGAWLGCPRWNTSGCSYRADDDGGRL